MTSPREIASRGATRLRRNAQATLLGNVAYALGLWLQLVVFARAGGAAAVGSYAAALALTSPVMLLSHLQLRTLLASDARNSYSFREYRRLRVATTAAALLAMIPVAVASGQWEPLWPLLVPVCAKAAADAFSDVYCGLWQKHERMGMVGWTLAFNAFSSVACMVSVAWAGGRPPAIAAAGAVASWATFAFLHVRTALDPELRADVTHAANLDWRRLVRLAREAVPLGIIVLLGSLQLNVPRYFIQGHAGAAALGLFAAAYQLTAAGGMVVQALGSAATPRMAGACARGDVGTFRHLVRMLLFSAGTLAVLGVTASALIGRPVLELVFQPEFAAASDLLVVLSVSAGIGFVATLLGYALTAARVIAVQPVLLSAALLVTGIACALLVPRMGALGACWALVLASFVQAVWSAVALNRFKVTQVVAPELPAAGGMR